MGKHLSVDDIKTKVYGVGERYRITPDGVTGSALVTAQLNDGILRNGKPTIRIYVHVYDGQPYMEYNIAPLGRKKDSHLFTDFKTMDQMIKTHGNNEYNKDPDNPVWEKPYIKEIILPSVALREAFISYGWPEDVLTVKAARGQLHVSIDEQVYKNIERYIREYQTTYPAYTLARFCNDALSAYFKLDSLVQEAAEERKVTINLGNNTVALKRASARTRHNIITGSVAVDDDGEYYISIRMGVRGGDAKAAGRPQDFDEITEIETRRFTSVKDIETAIRPYLIMSDDTVIKEIFIRNTRLHANMISAGWDSSKITTVVSSEPGFDEFLVSYETEHGRPWPGERVFLYMDGASVSARGKAVYTPEDGLYIEYNAYGKEYPEANRFFDVDSLSEAVGRKTGYPDRRLIRICTGNSALYGALADKFGEIVSMTDTKHAIHTNITPELEKKITQESERKNITKTEVAQKAFIKFLQKA